MDTTRGKVSTEVAHFITKQARKKPARSDDVARALRRFVAGGLSNPIETTVKIAFANGTDHSPKAR
jgi:hypothetical protein